MTEADRRTSLLAGNELAFQTEIGSSLEVLFIAAKQACKKQMVEEGKKIFLWADAIVSELYDKHRIDLAKAHPVSSWV